MIVDLQKAIELIPALIQQAEHEIKGESSGPERRKFVIDSVNAIIDLPFVPESVEETALGFIVDGIVTAFNKLFGKNWIKKVDPLEPVDVPS